MKRDAKTPMRHAPGSYPPRDVSPLDREHMLHTALYHALRRAPSYRERLIALGLIVPLDVRLAAAATLRLTDEERASFETRALAGLTPTQKHNRNLETDRYILSEIYNEMAY